MASSNVTTVRRQAVETVVEIARTHRAVLAEALNAVLYDGGSSDAQLQALLDGPCGALAQAWDELHEAEIARWRALSGDSEHARDVRDAAMDAVRGALEKLRDVLTSVYGLAAAERICPTPIPVTGTALARAADETARRLRRTDLPPPRIAGAHFDAAAAAAALQQRKATLQGHLRVAPVETHEALDAMQLAVARFDSVLAAVAGFYESLLTVVGSHDLARTVRPSRTRPGLLHAMP